MLHKWRRRLSRQDMGKAGILLTFITGIGAAVIFQDLLLLRNNDQFPANQFLANKLKRATALVAGKLGLLEFKYNLFYRKILCQFVNCSLFLPGMRFDRKRLLGGLFCLVALAVFCFIEEIQLSFFQNIAFLLTGLTKAGSLGIGKYLIHVLKFSLQFVNFLPLL